MGSHWSLMRAVLVMLFAVAMLVGCGDAEEDAQAESEPENAGVSVGTYEGEWTMSATTKPLVSLVMEDDGSYEFFVSIMGLVESGAYSLADDGTLTFAPESGAEHTGTYTEGMVDAAFELGGSPVDLTFIQVGSPDDVYDEFLGDYLGEVDGEQFLLELIPGRQYSLSLTNETGTFAIADGQITLTPNGSGRTVTAPIDLSTKAISLPQSGGTVELRKLGWDEVARYEGMAEKGMGGGTPVTVIFKPAGHFELITSKPRGRGRYSVESAADGYALTLTYSEPAERPDNGEPFVLTGTISSNDPFVADTTVTIDTVEYIVVMQADPSVMDLGGVELTRVTD